MSSITTPVEGRLISAVETLTFVVCIIQFLHCSHGQLGPLVLAALIPCRGLLISSAGVPLG